VRLYGADNADALRGIYLDAAAGAVFIGTPKGRNAFFELWRRAQSQADWFTLMRRRT